jgi:hypothetical protein
MTREIIAYGLIALTLIGTVPWLAVTWARRKRRKLRQRGIKTFGH